MPAQSDQFVSLSLFWFTLTLVNAGLAQAKDRSGLMWWLGSIFLGPIATLLIVVLPRGGPATAQPLTTLQLVALAAAVTLLLLLAIGLLAWGGPPLSPVPP
jgi:hypothetical protein